MGNEKEIKEVREKIINIGKEVATQQTATKFPDWCFLKIGINTIQGNIYDYEYYESLIEPPVKSTESD